jgi:Domain of unknown function (DUF397)
MSTDRLTDWIKASVSDSNGSCVELRRNGGAVEVRDTKQQGQGPVLAFSPAAFAAWLDGAAKGEFGELL